MSEPNTNQTTTRRPARIDFGSEANNRYWQSVLARYAGVDASKVGVYETQDFMGNLRALIRMIRGNSEHEN